MQTLEQSGHGRILRLGRAERALVERERLFWLSADHPLDVAIEPLLRAQLRVLDTAQWANFAAWD